jgi:hypothetical protein
LELVIGDIGELLDRKADDVCGSLQVLQDSGVHISHHLRNVLLELVICMLSNPFSVLETNYYYFLEHFNVVVSTRFTVPT